MVIGIDASRGNLAERTGTEWYTFHLLQALKRMIPSTVNIRLYVKEPLRQDWGQLPPNWEVRVLNWPPKLLWTQLRLSLELLLHPPELLFVPAHTIPIIHPPTVLVVHDLGFERTRALYGTEAIGHSSWFGRLLSPLVRLLTFGRFGTSELDYHRFAMRFGVRQAKHIISISHFTKQELIDLFPVPPKQITVIYHGAPEPLPEIQTPASRTAQLLYVGRIERKKNLITVLNALAEIPAPHRPVFICVGKDGLGADEFDQKVKQLQLESFVKKLGWLPGREIKRWYQSATAAILPSYYEGFGLPILEAWNARLPMIVSSQQALAEIGDYAVAQFETENAHACAVVIQRVLSNPAVRQELMQRGRDRLKLFSWDLAAQETWNVIQSCAKIPE